jgi:hypothetical protein
VHGGSLLGIGGGDGRVAVFAVGFLVSANSLLVLVTVVACMGRVLDLPGLKQMACHLGSTVCCRAWLGEDAGLQRPISQVDRVRRLV